jgi:hypothetical protein
MLVIMTRVVMVAPGVMRDVPRGAMLVIMTRVVMVGVVIVVVVQ